MTEDEEIQETMRVLEDRERELRYLRRLNRRPLAIKWQLVIFAVLCAFAIGIGAAGWMCRQ